MTRITIVEDLPIVLEGLKLIISKVKDFELLQVYSDGKEFTDNLLSVEADIILMDIDMPVMDGITATKIALAKKPELKVIALSMYNDKKYYYEMVSAGAKGFVLKQSPPKELETAIREVHAGGNFFSGEILRNVILQMNSIEEELVQEKKSLLELSDRETEYLRLICQGLNNKEISEQMCVSLRTVETSKSRLMKKTNSRNNAGLILWSIKNKIVQL